MSDLEARMAHMRATAIGRIQVAAQLRLYSTDELVNGIRSGAAAGLTVDEITIESGLAADVVQGLIDGTGYRRLRGDVAA